MAVELGRYIKGRLSSLPPDHRDRAYLEGLLKATEGYCARIDNSVAVFGSVDHAVTEYKSKPLTPELVTKVHRTIWSKRGRLIGQTYEVTPCPYTSKELADLEHQGRRVGYLPPQLATQQNRHLLGEMFPGMRSDSVQEDNPVTNDENPSGWFDYETSIDAPYLNTTEPQLRETVAKEGREPLTLNQYIIASLDSELLTEQYLDEGATAARLGSRHGGRVVSAYFDQDGHLSVGWGLEPGGHYQWVGGRSSGVKKA